MKYKEKISQLKSEIENNKKSISKIILEIGGYYFDKDYGHIISSKNKDFKKETLKIEEDKKSHQKDEHDTAKQDYLVSDYNANKSNENHETKKSNIIIVKSGNLIKGSTLGQSLKTEEVQSNISEEDVANNLVDSSINQNEQQQNHEAELEQKEETVKEDENKFENIDNEQTKPTEESNVESVEIDDNSNTENQENFENQTEVIEHDLFKNISDIKSEINYTKKQEMDIKEEVRELEVLENEIRNCQINIESCEKIIKLTQEQMTPDLILLGDYIYKNSSLLISESEKSSFGLISELEQAHKDLKFYEKQKEEIAQTHPTALNILTNIRLHSIKSKINKLLIQLPMMQKKLALSMFNDIIETVKNEEIKEDFLKSLFDQNQKIEKEASLLNNHKTNLATSKERLKEICSMSPPALVKSKKVKTTVELIKKQDKLKHELGEIIINKNLFQDDKNIIHKTDLVSDLQEKNKNLSSIIVRLENAIRYEAIEKEIEKKSVASIDLDKLIEKKKTEKEYLDKNIEEKRKLLEELKVKIGDIDEII